MNYNRQKVSYEIIGDGTHYMIMSNWNITSVPNRVVKKYFNSIMNRYPFKSLPLSTVFI